MEDPSAHWPPKLPPEKDGNSPDDHCFPSLLPKIDRSVLIAKAAQREAKDIHNRKNRRAGLVLQSQGHGVPLTQRAFRYPGIPVAPSAEPSPESHFPVKQATPSTSESKGNRGSSAASTKQCSTRHSSSPQSSGPKHTPGSAGSDLSWMSTVGGVGPQLPQREQGSRRMNRILQSVSGITSLNVGPKALNQATYRESLQLGVTAEQLVTEFAKDILLQAQDPVSVLDAQENLSVIGEMSQTSDADTYDDEDTRPSTRLMIPMPTVEPPAARCVPFLFQQTPTLLESSHSYHAVKKGSALNREESAFPDPSRTNTMSSVTEWGTSRDPPGDGVRHKRLDMLKSVAQRLHRSNFSGQYPAELAWTYPGTHPSVHMASSSENHTTVSTYNPVLPFTPLTAVIPGRPISREVAQFKDHISKLTNPLELGAELTKLSTSIDFDGELEGRLQLWETATRRQLEIDNAHVKSWEEIETDIMLSAPKSEDVGPYYCWGEIGRFQRRYHREQNPKVFNLSHTMFGESRMGPLVELLMIETSIERLLLRNNAITDDGLQLLVNCLTRAGCKVRSLDLSDNHLTENAALILVPTIKYTARSALKHKPPSGRSTTPPHGLLQELTLSGNRIGSAGTATLMRNMASKTCHIRVLDLSRCDLGEGAAAEIGELLEGTRCLERLYLGWNRFGVRGSKVISEAMKCNSSVKVLSLPWAGMGDRGASHIANILEANHTMRILDISGNSISGGTCLVLNEMMKGKKGLDELIIRDNPIGSFGARHLMKAVTSGYCKYIDLRGSSFSGSYDCDYPHTHFNPKRPDGLYKLNLGDAADNVIAKQLFDLAQEQGAKCWRNAKLDGTTLRIANVLEKGGWRLPEDGELTLGFSSTKRPSADDAPLTDEEFENIWIRLACEEGAECAMTDRWKVELLEVLCSDCFFTCAQAQRIVQTMGYGGDKVEAAVLVFGRIVDPEYFNVVTSSVNPAQETMIIYRLGILKMFHPTNPTGSYDLILGQQAHYMTARRLLDAFCRQWKENLCEPPTITCMPHFSLEGDLTFIKNPHEVVLPREGRLQIHFADLRPIPPGVQPMSSEYFTVVLLHLVNADRLDGPELMNAVKDVKVGTAVGVLSHFTGWTGKNIMYPSPDRGVKDVQGVVQALRMLSIHNYIQCWQLREIVALLPSTCFSQRVDIVSMFWARAVDRKSKWAIFVLQCLKPAEQVAVCQRLGYLNTFDIKHPEMHYQLRMSRPDEYQTAFRLYKMALHAQHSCMSNFHIDGQERRVNNSTNLWSVMRGNAPEGEMPTVTLEFDFVWPDLAKLNWAATMVQAAFKALMTRRRLRRTVKSAGIATIFTSHLRTVVPESKSKTKLKVR